MHRSSLSALPLLALALIHCNNPMLIVDVDIDYLPPGTQRLLLVTTLNGQPGKEQRFSTDERRVAVNLPTGATGTVGLRVYGIDAGDCILSEGSLDAPVPIGLNRTEQFRVKMSSPSNARCSFTVLRTGLGGLVQPDLKAVWGSDANNVYVVGGGGQQGAPLDVMLRCVTDSAACSPLPAAAELAVGNVYWGAWGADASSIFVAHSSGQVVRCAADAGSCSAMISDGMRQPLRSIWGSDPENVYAVGDKGFILRCSGSTSRCNAMNPGDQSLSTHGFTQVWGRDSENVYVVGGNSDVAACQSATNSSLVRCRAGSSDCVKFAIPSAISLCSVGGGDPQRVYSVGGSGTIVRCNPASNVCTKLNSGTTAHLYSVWSSDPDNVYAVGTNTIVRCQAGSDACTVLTHGATSTFRGVWGSDPQNVYVVGSGGVVVRCAAADRACAQVTSGTKSDLSAVYGTDSNDVYIVGANGTILRRRL